MNVHSTLILALIAVAMFAVGAKAGGDQKDHPHLWIKSEFRAKSTECFIADGFLFCPYDADMPNVVYTVIDTDDLPPAVARQSG